MDINTTIDGTKATIALAGKLTVQTAAPLKAEVMGDETQAALIREYRRMQMTMQMNLMTGQPNDPEETQRFSTLTGLLFSKPQVSEFLLAEMRLQQTLADIMKIVTEATGLEIQMPG